LTHWRPGLELVEALDLLAPIEQAPLLVTITMVETIYMSPAPHKNPSSETTGFALDQEQAPPPLARSV
jgi:hypothetical protein